MQTIYLVTGLPGVGKTSFLQVLEGLKLLPEYSVTPQRIARIYNSSETYAMQKLIDDGRSFLCELPLEQEKMEQFFGLLEGKTYAINCYCMGLPDAAEAIARLVRRDRTGVPTAKILEDFELFPSNIRELSRRVESIKFFDNTHGFCLTGYKYPYRLELRLNETQMARLQSLASKSGLSMSAYVRQLIDGVLPQERPPLDFYKMLTELRYIGNNMNQLTRIAHATGRIDREKFERLTDEIKPLASMLYRYVTEPIKRDPMTSELGTYIRKSDQKALKEKREEERKWR